jgi:hypothetical protein
MISKEGSWQRSGCRRPCNTYVVFFGRRPQVSACLTLPRQRPPRDTAQVSAPEGLTPPAVARHGIPIPRSWTLRLPLRRPAAGPLRATWRPCPATLWPGKRLNSASPFRLRGLFFRSVSPFPKRQCAHQRRPERRTAIRAPRENHRSVCWFDLRIETAERGSNPGAPTKLNAQKD